MGTFRTQTGEKKEKSLDKIVKAKSIVY
jgi:hypothetical protein